MGDDDDDINRVSSFIVESTSVGRIPTDSITAVVELYPVAAAAEKLGTMMGETAAGAGVVEETPHFPKYENGLNPRGEDAIFVVNYLMKKWTMMTGW